MLSSNNFGYNDIIKQSKYDLGIDKKLNKKNKKNKKLIKGGGIIKGDANDNDKDLQDNSSEESEEKYDYNSEILDSQNFSEYGDDYARFIKIPKGGKKNPMRNYGTLLIIKVHEALGKNMIKVDEKEYKDVKIGDTIKVNKNQIYEILNFSNYELIVQLIIDDENNED